VSSQGVVSCGKFVRVALRLRKGRSKIVEVRKWLKKTQLKGSSCKRLNPNEFLNGDVGFTLVNLNFEKQILVSPCGLPHYSFL